jgi:hypothetical protein
MKKIQRNASGASVKPYPAGPHPARLTVIADLGLREGQWGEKFELGLGVEIYFREAETWSALLVPDVVTYSINENSLLHQYVMAILGECPDELDPTTLLCRGLLVTIKNRPAKQGGFFPGIDKVIALPASATLPAIQASCVVFDRDAPDQQVFEGLPRLFKKIIEDNWLRQGSAATTPVGDATSGTGRFSQNPFSAPSQEGGYFAAQDTSAKANGRGALPEASEPQLRVPNPFTDPEEATWWAGIAEASPKPRNNPFQI